MVVSPVKPRVVLADDLPAAEARASAASAPGHPTDFGAERDDEPTAPADAMPLPAAAAGAAVEVSFQPDAPVARLLPAIEAVTELLRAHPGSLPVLLDVPVAGAHRQVRLPGGVAWDDRLADAVHQAAGLPVAVALRGDPAGS